MGNSTYESIDLTNNTSIYLKISDNSLFKKIDLTDDNGNPIENENSLLKKMRKSSGFISQPTSLRDIYIAFTFLDESNICYIINLNNLKLLIDKMCTEINKQTQKTFKELDDLLYSNFDKVILSPNISLYENFTDADKIKHLMSYVYNKIGKSLKTYFLQSNFIPPELSVDLQQPTASLPQLTASLPQQTKEDVDSLLEKLSSQLTQPITEHNKENKINSYDSLLDFISKKINRQLEKIENYVDEMLQLESNKDKYKIIKKYSIVYNIITEIDNLLNKIFENKDIFAPHYLNRLLSDKNAIYNKLMSKLLDEYILQLSDKSIKKLKDKLSSSVGAMNQEESEKFLEIKTKIDKILNKTKPILREIDTLKTSEDDSEMDVIDKYVTLSDDEVYHYSEITSLVNQEIEKAVDKTIKNIKEELRDRELYFGLDEINHKKTEIILDIKSFIIKILKEKKINNSHVSIIFALVNIRKVENIFEKIIALRGVYERINGKLFEEFGEILDTIEPNDTRQISKIATRFLKIIDDELDGIDLIFHDNKFIDSYETANKITELIEENQNINDDSNFTREDTKRTKEVIKSKGKHKPEGKIRRTKGSKGYRG